MTNYKEILRLHSLGINNTRIAESCGCARSTVIAALQRAAEQELSWNKIKTAAQKKSPESYIHLLHWDSSTRCRITNGYTERCRRAALP